MWQIVSWYTIQVRIKLFTVITAVIILVGAAWLSINHLESKKATSNTANTTQRTSNTVSRGESGFNKEQYSLTDPTSIWVITNKQHPIEPITYIPSDLTVPSVPLSQPGAANMQMRSVTATALEQLFAAAKQDNINLDVVSAYRSYSYQQSVYGQYVQTSGQAAADQESARPGYSEHQTGLAVDIGIINGTCTLEQCFGSTPQGQWLVANAYKYGFILRYPADKTTVTGYEYEPWHFRYVGTTLSEEMHKDNIETLEEFFGVSGGTVYKTAS